MELNLDSLASSSSKVEDLANNGIAGCFATLGSQLKDLEESGPVNTLLEALSKVEKTYNEEVIEPINNYLNLSRQQIPELDEFLKKSNVDHVKSRKATTKKFGIDFSAFQS